VKEVHFGCGQEFFHFIVRDRALKNNFASVEVTEAEGHRGAAGADLAGQGAAAAALHHPHRPGRHPL